MLPFQHRRPSGGVRMRHRGESKVTTTPPGFSVKAVAPAKQHRKEASQSVAYGYAYDVEWEYARLGGRISDFDGRCYCPECYRADDASVHGDEDDDGGGHSDFDDDGGYSRPMYNRVTQARARGREFCLSKKDLAAQPHVEKPKPHHPKFAPMKLYKTEDLWAAVLKKHGSALGVREAAAKRAATKQKRKDARAV